MRFVLPSLISCLMPLAATMVATNSVALCEDATAQVDSNAGAVVSLLRVSNATEKANGTEVIAIAGTVQTGSYTLSRLQNPERLVLDVRNISGIKNDSWIKVAKEQQASVNQISSKVSVDGSQWIQKVRVGAHSDKTRFVFDLTATATAEALTANAVLGQSGLEIVLKPKSDITQAATAEFANAPVEATQVTTSAKNSTTTLLNYDVEANGSSNALVATFSNPPVFSMKRTSPSEYVINVKSGEIGTGIPENLVVPPMGSENGAIRSVRPVIDSEGLGLRVFVQPSTKLVARSNGSALVVSANSTIETDTPRAQLAPAKETASTDKKTAEDAVVVKDTSGEKAPAVTEADNDAISSLLEETPKYTGRLISLDLQDTDIDNALRIIAEVSNLNIIASEDVTGKVTLRLIDVPWDQALDVILKTNGLDKVQEGNVIRIAPVEKLRQEREALKQASIAEEELEPLSVKYIRVSYSKASELKTLTEAVLTERGTVTYDDRTNQLIVKDIRKGVKNVAELVNKVDLRTPQVLLETQIVEAQRTLLRDLGAELGFNLIQSPETGNGTGKNFPSSIAVGGSRPGGVASSFPSAGASGAFGSAVNFLFGSADGTANVTAAISALEDEGRIRVVSRPSVATTNNKQATIKSVEKIRVKTPSGGLSVATGAGSQAAGNGGAATQTIEIGITLDVTPQASPDYYVLLDIDAKSSTFGSRTVDGIPSEVERSATSTVLVSSGQTFAMGGIYKLTDNDNVTGVPFLKDIPVLGTFFRRQKVENSDEELLFFITPRIIEGSFDDATMKVQS